MGRYLGQLLSAMHPRDDDPSKKLQCADFSQCSSITVKWFKCISDMNRHYFKVCPVQSTMLLLRGGILLPRRRGVRIRSRIGRAGSQTKTKEDLTGQVRCSSQGLWKDQRTQLEHSGPHFCHLPSKTYFTLSVLVLTTNRKT